jgi:hypothetical protein
MPILIHIWIFKVKILKFFDADPGSWIEKIQISVPGSGLENSRINIPDPQHCVLGIETDPDWPDLDWHGLDADPDPEKIMRIRPDLEILIHKSVLEYMDPTHLCKLS